jgi:hypothetical protein
MMNRDREIEIRCSTPGCTRKTKAGASHVDKNRRSVIGDTNEAGWIVPNEGPGMYPTDTGRLWAWGTCPEHAKKQVP